MKKLILTFNIKLLFGAYADSEWQSTMEIESSSSLDELHYAIQDAVGFDNDHLFEFYISRTERSRSRERFDDENERIYTTNIEDLYPLEKDKKLYYLFDYGDSWLFKITKTRKSPQVPKKGVRYPRVVKEVGKKPEQYPDWEE